MSRLPLSARELAQLTGLTVLVLAGFVGGVYIVARVIAGIAG